MASGRFSAVIELTRVPEQVKTCERTRVKRTSVVTDGNEESEKNKCAVCAEKEPARVWKGCRRQGGTERSGVETER